MISDHDDAIRIGFVSAVAIILFCIWLPVAHAQKSVLGELIVQFKNNIPANSMRADVIDEIPQINTKLIKAPEVVLDKLIESLSKNPNVISVERNYLYETTQVIRYWPNDPLFNQQWSLRSTGVNIALNTSFGGTSPIAILDTGIDMNHPDIASKIVFEKSWSPPGDLADVCNHGTAVAGIAGAIGDNNIGIAGIDMTAPIIPLKITNSDCIADS